MEYFARICCQANDATGDSHKKTGEHGYITIQEGFIMKTSCLEGTRYVHEQEIQFVLHYYLLKDTQNSRPCYGIRIVKTQSIENQSILEESDQIFLEDASMDKAISLLNLFISGKVTPIGLKDIMDDLTNTASNDALDAACI